ncbi:hypothetical protein FA15DRAFT_753372 [Coprinopsis marcescibilis]|uniref:Chromatin target of PRMT1 protein C-terminal domain-containing protein n=1 Tax=Coprinopsis marcescibilis TaxID=230819 RepID=A0A5C3L6Q0_COPMA|nr:hypothetical protein FA15DRAFT_753372 [Coprinopsis marcescibilis]
MDMLADDSIAPESFGASEPAPTLLSYDDATPYEEQIAVDTESSRLADRIGRGKIYLLSESASAGSSGARASGKRKALDGPEEEDTMMEDDGLEEDPEIRSNALFLSGPPISHLPTTRIFAYATHFEAQPLGLEWVSDTSCVLVFPSSYLAKRGYAALQKQQDEDISIDDGSVTAKPIPVVIWPAEERISRTLGLALGKSTAGEPTSEDHEREKRREGLSGPLRMRWARKDDVKKRGAKKESEFYRKHGELAGKELVNGRDIPSVPGSRKRQRDDGLDDDAQRARLDEELDAFLAQDSDGSGDEAGAKDDQLLVDKFSNEDALPSPPASPPSKMRSDYIADDGRTMLNKGSRNRSQNDKRRRERGGRRRHGDGDSSFNSLSLSDRLGQPREERSTLEWGPERKRRRDEGLTGDRRSHDAVGRGEGDRRRGGRNERPKKTQEELDAELDAFLNEGTAV